MELFDYDITTKKVSKYETNHLHMYVDGNIEFPNVEDMGTEDYATFIHEYVHYIQHLSTLFGVRICDMNQRMFLLYKDYLSTHNEITVPLHLWDSDDKLKNFRDTFKNIAGDRSCSHNINAVDVYPPDVEGAKKNRTAVNIGCYDFDNDKIVDKGFQFGYYCIIESMAHAIQTIINKDIVHDTVPYKAVELILKEVEPDYADDPKMIASLCLCSLHWDNPGVGFFEVLDIQRQYKFKDGLVLYKHIAKDYPVSYQGKRMPRYSLMEKFLKELKINLEQIIGVELEYYNRVLDSCITEAGLVTSKLLEVLYNDEITDSSKFNMELADYYGFPFIDADNYTALPAKTIGEEKRPYLESACLYGMELIMARLIESKGITECRRFKYCSKNMYSDPDNCLVTEDCQNEQWEKEENCVFTSALKYYKWGNKKFEVSKKQMPPHHYSMM